MKLTFTNGTASALAYKLEASQSSVLHAVTVPAGGSTTTTPYKGATSIQIEVDNSEKEDPPSVGVSNKFSATLPLKLGAKWKSVRLPSDSPWRIYSSKISKSEYRISVFPQRDLATFLSQIPDTVPLSSLLLPGTHDTMAFHGWPVSQCQSCSTPLAVQLSSGIRVIDVRLAVVDSRLIAYHGIFPQRTPFQDMLSDVHNFLTGPETSRETIVMSIKQEDFQTTPLPLFSQTVHDEIMNGPGGRDMWFLENRIPNLGEVRGKVVMLSRFGGDGSGWENGLEGLGIHPTAWPDSAMDGFTWTLKGTLVRTSDWYNIPSFLHIPEKTQLATENLLPPPEYPASPVLNISFFSAASFPLAFPPTVAKGFGWPNIGLGVEGVNGRLGTWLLDQLSSDDTNTVGQDVAKTDRPEKATSANVRIRGWAMLDFYSEPESVVPLLVECNFRGRISGEEGWP